MAAIDKIPGDCKITAVVGDQLDIHLAFTDQGTPPEPIDLTGYTLDAKIFIPEYSNPEGGFGQGDYTIGGIAATFTVTPVDLEAGEVSIGLTETQTAALGPGQAYRWYFRWVDPDGVTTTVLSGVFDSRIP